MNTPSELLSNFLKASYDVLTHFNLISTPLWTSYGCVMSFLGTYCKLLMNFLQISYEIVTNFYKSFTNCWKPLEASFKLIMNFLNRDKSVASFYCQVSSWASDMFCNFYLVKSHKIANNSATIEAREKISTYLESLEF